MVCHAIGAAGELPQRHLVSVAAGQGGMQPIAGAYAFVDGMASHMGLPSFWNVLMSPRRLGWQARVDGTSLLSSASSVLDECCGFVLVDSCASLWSFGVVILGGLSFHLPARTCTCTGPPKDAEGSAVAAGAGDRPRPAEEPQHGPGAAVGHANRLHSLRRQLSAAGVGDGHERQRGDQPLAQQQQRGPAGGPAGTGAGAATAVARGH